MTSLEWINVNDQVQPMSGRKISPFDILVCHKFISVDQNNSRRCIHAEINDDETGHLVSVWFSCEDEDQSDGASPLSWYSNLEVEQLKQELREELEKEV